MSVEPAILTRRGMLRFAALGLALSGGAALLAACGTSSSTATVAATSSSSTASATQVVKSTVSSSASTKPVASAPNVNAGKVTITIWDEVTGAAAKTPSGVAQLAEQKEFAKLYPNIIVKRSAPPSGTNVRAVFAAANAGGTAPTIFDSLYHPSVVPYSQSGFLLDLTDRIKSWKYYKDVVPAAIDEFTYNGKIWGMPVYIYVMMLWARSDLLQAAGLPNRLPKDWNELATFAQKLTVPTKNQYGFGLLGMAWTDWYWQNFVWQAGGDVTKELPNGDVELTFVEKPGVTATQFYHDLVFKYKCVEPNVLAGYGTLEAMFYSKATPVAMWMGGNGSPSTFVSNGLRQSQFIGGPLPAGPTGIRKCQLGGTAWSISPQAKPDQQEAAWTYISWRASPEWQILDWKLQDSNGVVPSPTLPVILNLDQSKYQSVPKEWVTWISEAAKISRPGFYYKDVLEPYLAGPIQACITNASANVSQTLLAGAKKIVGAVKHTVLPKGY